MLKTKLYFDINADQCPIIYSHNYDIGFYGIEKLHPFDVGKWGKAHQKLVKAGIIRPGQSVQPNEASEEDLLQVHTEKYLRSLKSSTTAARISEICPLILIPACVIDSKLLKPLRYQTGGSILGTKLAKERGWAINLGGGFHHCCSKTGGGFCFYADISLCATFLLGVPELNTSRVMIVDLDAHQGNGHERDMGANNHVFILDAYNKSIYPQDAYAKSRIQCSIPLDPFTGDRHYLRTIDSHLAESLRSFKPDFVIYNAGTDILENDPLGNLSITKGGIIQRDQIVFTHCTEREIPILMLTSGGYQRETADIIADSIINLISEGIIKV